MRLAFVAAMFAVVAVGCGPSLGGMRDARSDPNAGVSRQIDAPCAKVFRLALRTAEVLHLDVLSDDRANGEILLGRGSRATAGARGDRIAIWLDRKGGGHACEVRIYARRSAMVSVADEDWPPYFFRQMQTTAADDVAETE